MKIQAYEVDGQGLITEHYLLTKEEIVLMRDNGKTIITVGWHDKELFIPKWDFQNEEWVESLTNEEVNLRRKEIEEKNKKMSAENIITLALLELATEIEKMKGEK